MSERVNLLGLDLPALQLQMEAWGEKPYRATQLLKWIHQAGVTDFSLMSNLSKVFRAKLEDKAEVRPPILRSEHEAPDGTIKWLFEVDGGGVIETVFIPEPKRHTLCISSQVGCALNCRFCHTAQQGFQANLSAAEIIGQLFCASAYLRDKGKLTPDGRPLSNVVFMGMGEPLLNMEAVLPALALMGHDSGYGLSKRRVTVSTSGVIPGMDRLAQTQDVALALSLHAPIDTLRTEIVPLNKKYPLADLMSACRRYIGHDKRRRVTMEYVMLDGVNDGPQEAKALVRLLQSVPSKVNLIPFNPFKGTAYRCSSPQAIQRFYDILMQSGVMTTVRKTRGDKIQAACGQLAGIVQDRTRRTLTLRQEA